MDKRKFNVFILNWRLYHGVSMDAGDPYLAPGIWAVALNKEFDVTRGDEPPFKVYPIEAGSIEECFRILNIAHPKGYDNRSLSVGDAVVEVATNKVYVCARVGWTELNTDNCGLNPFFLKHGA